MEQEIYYLIKDLGFPVVVAVLLIIDKLKTQDKLIKVIETNNRLLIEIKHFLERVKFR